MLYCSRLRRGGMNYHIEKEWITESGFRAAIAMQELGHRCGYVAVPKNHVLYGAKHHEQHESLIFPQNETIGKRGVIPFFFSDPDKMNTPAIVFDVHGGITYSEDSLLGVEGENLWWFGFDCGHSGDAPSPEYLEEQRRKYPSLHSFTVASRGVHRTLEYCIDECESLARQLIDRINVGCKND